MCFKIFKNTVLLLVFVTISCGSKTKNERLQTNETITHNQDSIAGKEDKQLIVAANRTSDYLDLLRGKRVGVVANQTSVIFKDTTGIETNFSRSYTHLVDSLLSLNINIKKVFAPEHGFRGTADAGELVKNGIDTKTSLPIISLYGKNKKPNRKDLEDLDILIFDIQDVGARFYTYISSLHYIMEACAEQNISLLIFDRPNPNGHYIDGPILEMEHNSFVGMHPIPVTHGMTIGEYAQMINGEGWMKNKIKCDIQIITVKNYTHQSYYSLPIKPSPNLPNDASINLYSSLCFLEGTNVSIGRGTDKQFQVIGSPFYNLDSYTFKFTPQSNIGAKYPKHKDKICYGYDLSDYKTLNQINLSWLIDFYKANQKHAPKEVFFTDYFTLLAGTKTLQHQIENGLSEIEIKESWKDGLKAFRKTRKAYLLYK